MPQAPQQQVTGGQQMPPWLLRAFVLAATTVVVFAAGIWLLGRLRGLLVLVLIALFLALAIEPAVNWLAAKGWRRGPATGLMFVVLGVLVLGFAGVLGSLLAGQASTILNGFPRYVDSLIRWVNSTFHTHLSQRTFFDRLPNLVDQLGRHVSDLAGNALGIGATALGVLFQSLGVLLFAFYLSADGPKIRRGVCALLPPHRQREVLRAWEIAIDKTGGYIYSRALLALISGTAHYVAMRVLGVPNALTLALWVGVVSQFIPAVGTYLAGAVPVLVALAVSPVTALWMLVFIAGYQQLENLVLQPRITATTLDMHPAVAFGTVLAGVAILGPIGALLALPATASLQAFAGAYIRRYAVEEHPLTAQRPPGRRLLPLLWSWLRRPWRR
jgi:predicted PurR-regulated permease PerM